MFWSFICPSSSGFILSQFSSCHSRQTDDDQIRSLCGALAAVRQNDLLLIISLDYYNEWQNECLQM